MTDKIILPENTFYILEASLESKKEQSIHVEMGTAVTMIHGYIEDDVEAERISLMRVHIEANKLSAQGIPWSTIAIELIKAVKKQ